MNQSEIKTSLADINENDTQVCNSLDSAMNEAVKVNDFLKHSILAYFEKHDKSECEFSDVYKLCEHRELNELTEQMEAIEKQETEEFLEDEKMKKDYLDQIKITLNNGVGGRRKDMLRRNIIKGIQGFMRDCSMYNDKARETIQFDIDIKVTFSQSNTTNGGCNDNG